MTDKPIDNDTIFECPYCKKALDIEDYYPEEHDGHVEHAFHYLDIDCPTCEGDEPAHCPAYMESAIDMAMESYRDG